MTIDVQALCGWIPPENRTREQHEASGQAIQAMPRFAIQGEWREDVTKACLFEVWSHPDVVAALGYAFPGTHQITGSCFPGGTPVRMADGSEKAIEAIQAGEQVITHRGRARRVVDTMTRLYDGNLMTLHVSGFPFPLEMTADHQVAVLPSRCDWRWQPGELEWKRADEIEESDRVLIGWGRDGQATDTLDVAELLGDRALVLDDLMEGKEVPVSNAGMARWIVNHSGIDWHGKVKLVRSRSEKAISRHVPVGPSLARLIGLYLAEGGQDGGKVVFSFGGDEESLCGEVLALVRGLFGAEGETFISNDRGTARKVVFGNNTLAAVFEALVPGNVYSKRVPGVFFQVSEETKIALILGWLHGDGYAALHGRRKRNVRIQGVTASAGLARDMATLAFSCGMRASVSKRKPRGRSRAAFDVYLSGKRATALYPALALASKDAGACERDTDTNATEYGHARTVKRVERRTVEQLRVFDFEVEEDHSFLAGGLAVHNCVGAGGGNALFTLSAVEVVRLGDPERIVIPFWLLPYGKSRQRAGMRGRGEGSMGATFAEAVRQDGVLDANGDGLPKFSRDDGLVWGKSVELEWSDGAAIGEKWLSESRRHLVRTTAQCRTADDVRAAIVNGYPCTCASNWGGQMSPGTSGNPAVLLNRRSGSWSHQMSVQAWWQHPSLGEIFWIHNQWGVNTHGKCPSGAPGGGFWIAKSDMQSICDADEVFAFSGFDGFPSQDISWYI